MAVKQPAAAKGLRSKGREIQLPVLRGEGISRLRKTMKALPQAPVGVRHVFTVDCYMREMSADAGTLIMGRIQKHEHDCLLVRGKLRFYNEDDTFSEMSAPAEFRASPGRKVALVLEDVIFVNVYPTTERDVETLEREIFEDPAPISDVHMKRDRDYQTMLNEMGVTAKQVKDMSERTNDLIPWPPGVYKVKVGRSHIHGKGLIATCDIPNGEYIAPGTWEGKRTPAGRYTNHSKNPNARYIYDRKGLAWLVAIRPIAGSLGGADGEEVTVDYRLTAPKRIEELS